MNLVLNFAIDVEIPCKIFEYLNIKFKNRFFTNIGISNGASFSNNLMLRYFFLNFTLCEHIVMIGNFFYIGIVRHN